MPRPAFLFLINVIIKFMDAITLSDFKDKFFEIIYSTPNSQIGVMTLKPGEDSGPEDIHPGDQVVYVIEGEIEVEVRKKIAKLSAGMLLTIPSKSQHHIYNHGQRTAFLFSVYAPPSY